MNITELKKLVDEALEQGLHPETTVVIGHDGWYTHVDLIEHPKDGRSQIDLWFTITPSNQEADARFTPGHFEVPDPALHAEYLNLQENGILDDPKDGGPSYHEWLRQELADTHGMIADTSSRDTRGRLAGYERVVTLEAEIERLG